MLNLDWFQPFKDSIYSVGVLYLSFLNLLPQERNKEENIAIVGIIPGPQEPNRDVNSFLDPLVDELLDFLDGVWIDTPATGLKFCRLALVCVTCDIPASRKLCSFFKVATSVRNRSQDQHLERNKISLILIGTVGLNALMLNTGSSQEHIILKERPR